MTIPIAIFGAGAIARDHVAALRRIDGARVSHVFDRHPERAQALAAIAGGVAWTTDPDEIWRNQHVQAVDICTSPDSHAAFTIAAAEHGKAIHLEKPAALSLVDLDAMIEATRRQGVSLMVGQTARFQPVHRELASAITDGAVGRVRALHIIWYAGHVWPNGWRAWQLDHDRCGGHLVHNGVHAIDIAVWLFGTKPARVFARGFNTFAPAMPTPDSFHLTLRFDDGSLALLELCYSLRNRGDALRRVMAVGERGSLHHTTEGEPRLYSDAARLPSMVTEDAFFHQLSHWVATLRGEEEPIVRLEEVRATLATALAARRSYETGTAIKIEEASL